MIQAVHEHTFALRALDVAELAQAHYDLVYRFCARRVGIDAAADAAQETFLTAHRVSKGFRGLSSPTTWLLGIANNECRRMIRKQKISPPMIELRDDGCVSPESDLVNREALRQALAMLSGDHREAVILVELDGLSYEEAAVVTGVPAGTVKSRLHYAFQHLRKSLYAGGDFR